MATDNPRSTRVSRVAIATGEDNSDLRVTRLTPVVIYKALRPPDVFPPQTAGGWPGRAPRGDYGPEMADEKKVEDPTRQLGADVLNLWFWQLGALGLAAPKATILYAPAAAPPRSTEQLVFGALSWDQVVYTDAVAPFPNFTVSVLATGTFEFNFDPGVIGIDGNPQPLTFSGGYVAPVHLDGYVPGAAADRNLRGEFAFLDTNSFEARVRNSAGTLRDFPFMVVLW